MESISSTILLKAMDGLSKRAEVTANNIANANSPGYRSLLVSFEDTLRAAAASNSSRAIKQVQPSIGLAIDAMGKSEIRLDLEMATAATTAGRYGTLAELLNRRLQIEAMAASGSR